MRRWKMDLFTRASWMSLYREEIYVVRTSHYEGQSSDTIQSTVVSSAVSEMYFMHHLFVSAQMMKMHLMAHLLIRNRIIVDLDLVARRIVFSRYQIRILFSIDYVKIRLVKMTFMLHVMRLQFGR